MTFSEYLKYLFLIIFFPRSLKTMEWRMLRLLNRDRKLNGKLPPVRMQEDLRTVARKHSQDMAKKDYFEHVNLEGKSPSDRLEIARITEVTSGENLAKIGGYRNPTQFAENGLMNSPGHRANILQPLYNVVGIGIIQDLRKIYYFTQNFAKRDILFRKKFPKKLRVGRKLVLNGEVFSEVDSALIQIRFAGQKNTLHQAVVHTPKKVLHYTYVFSDPGIFEVCVFSHIPGHGSYSLCNKFEVKVFRGFWS